MAKSKTQSKTPDITVSSTSTTGDQSSTSQIIQPASIQTVDQTQLTFFNSITEMIKNEISKAQQQIKKETSNQVKKSINEIQKQVDSFEERRKDSEIKLFEALAVFIALFSYIAVNISIFTKVENLNQAIWFMVVMLFAFVCFLSVFSVILRQQTGSLRAWIPPVVLLILVGAVGYLTPFIPFKKESTIREEPKAAAKTEAIQNNPQEKAGDDKDGK